MKAAAKMLLLNVMGGLIALVAALVVATAIGLGLQWRSGRFRGVRGVLGARLAAPGAAGGPDAAAAPGAEAGSGAVSAPGAELLTEADLGGPLGRRATLVQFSTAFCAPCRPTRQILAQVAQLTEGVTHVEIDAATRLNLVRRLRINSTPTVLVLGPEGAVAKRATGLPRKADVIAALGAVIEPVPGVATSAGGE